MSLRTLKKGQFWHKCSNTKKKNHPRYTVVRILPDEFAKLDDVRTYTNYMYCSVRSGSTDFCTLFLGCLVY